MKRHSAAVILAGLIFAGCNGTQPAAPLAALLLLTERASRVPRPPFTRPFVRMIWRRSRHLSRKMSSSCHRERVRFVAGPPYAIG
jgi:hypothetical protein